MAKLSPVGISAQFINGIPANGAKMFFYASGSSTKQDTFTDSGGFTANPNPIILNSRGELPNEAWLTEGLAYKVVFAPSTDTDPPTSPIWDVDNVTGINDASLTIDQWINSGLIPTYVSATSFTVPGDQTSVFTNKRRLKSTVTAGTAYSTVLSSVFGALTTVTVVNDSTPLDSGLSSVQLGLITPNNTSLPSIIESFRATVAATATTTPLWVSTAQVQDWTGTPTITDFPDAPQAGVWREVYPASGTVFTDNANIDVQGDATYTVESGDKIYIEALTVSTFKVWIEKKTGLALSAISSYISALTATVATNALTVSINPFSSYFRSSTLNNGVPNSRILASIASVIAPSGATFGAPAIVTVSSATAAASTTLTLNAGPSTPIQEGDTLFISGVQSAKVVTGGTYAGGTGTGTVILDTAVTVTAAAVVFSHPTRLLVLAIDNAGTLEPAVVNQSGNLSLDETGLISTTAITSGSTSATTVYSTTSRSNLPYRVMGFVDVVQASSGVYAVAPILVQGATANSMAAMWAVGNGQIPTDLTSKRVQAQAYRNNNGRPVETTIEVQCASGATAVLTLTSPAGGTVAYNIGSNGNVSAINLSSSKVIPPGYNVTVSGASGLVKWIDTK